MSSNNQGASVAVRALEELPEEQREVFSARYMADETREATCKRLSMQPERYDELVKQIVRNLRRMAVPAPAQLARA